MKFLCDNCKAKYQIADDKVSGRTVRMKCRKCSHLIEIRASVTETSVALSSPASIPATANPAVGEGTMQVSLDALAAPRPPTRTAPVAVARAPVGAAAPRPGTAGLRPAAAGASPAAKADPSAASPGLAGSFSDSLRSEPAPAFEESPTHALDTGAAGLTEDWYVGINGVPVGPVRLTEFRAKIQSGAVNGDSLVWRDGFEEWLPLRNFPELAEILKAATQAAEAAPAGFGRPGATSRPLSAIASSALRSKSSANMAAVSVSSATPSPQGSAGPGATGRSNVIAFGRAATAEKLDFELGHPQPEMVSPPEPVAAPDPFASAPVVPTSPATAPDPFGASAPFASAPVAANFAPMAAPVLGAAAAPAQEQPRRGGIPLAGWFAIAAALGLGVVGGSVLSAKDPPPPTVQIVTVSAVAPAAPVPTETATVARPDTSAAPTASVTAAATGVKVAGVVPKSGATVEKTAEPATPQVGAVPAVGGVPAIGGVGGPAPGPVSTNSGGGGGEKLTGEQISAVVNGGRNALKRACWEPALAARAANGPSSARVVVSLTIGPDGRVQSANATGGDGFPSLASCIGSRVRSWSFPQSQTVTQTAPVFNFVAQ